MKRGSGHTIALTAAVVAIGATCMLHARIAQASAGGESPAARVSKPLKPGTFAASSAPFAQRLAPNQREEWRFLKDAAASSRFGHDAARMALAKSSDPAVRSLAATLVNQQSSAQTTLQQMLNARNMAAPMLSAAQRKWLDHLARQHGAKFDREWLEAVALRSQQEDVQAYERAAGMVRDPALRSWIASTLPAMRWQLASAERMSGGGMAMAKVTPARTAQSVAAPPVAAQPNPSDLGEGNMLLGPARPQPANFAVKFSESNSR
jgi:predicted outer membrane protein